jgi:hypothetical protein
MADILHRISVYAPAARVYKAIATRSGLINWWTWHVTGEPAPGAFIRFRFGAGTADVQVLEQFADHRVRWFCVAGPRDWISTEIDFDLVSTPKCGAETIVSFAHKGWHYPGEYMAQCNTAWACSLLSLKAWVENGRGTPYPEDDGRMWI